MMTRRPDLVLRALLMTIITGVMACAAPTTRTGTGPAPQNGAGELLYVCNQDDATVSIIDMATNRVIRTVDLQQLGFSATAKPHHVAVEPDGSYWYVTLIGESRIVKLDRNDRMVGQVPFETPGMLALHPTEDLLFVGRSMTAVSPPQRIGMLRRSDMMLNELPVFFPRPHALALEPRSGTLYTASLAVNQMAALRPLDEEVELLDVAGPAHALMQFAIAPDGRTLVVSGELSHQVLVFDITDPMSPRLTNEIAVGPQPFDPIFTPDGRWVYLGNKAANTVTVIDMSTRTVADVITGEGLAQPHGVAASRDGRFVYISNNNLGRTHDMAAGHEAHAAPAAAGRGTVVVIDTGTRQIVSVIEVGRNASGIGTRTYRR
ncbi:MAG: beta-propeller fold lactonase family protein [Longimicrobiales bacterium]